MKRRVTCQKCGCEFKLSGVPATVHEPSVGSDTDARAEETRADRTVKKIGRFEIRERVGAGAFGTVYRAYDPTLDREVALEEG